MASPRVLWEDNHLLIVFKPAGLLVQGDETGDPTLLDWAAEDVARRFAKPGKAFIGLPHRLDRPTSGIVVLCKTSKSLARMNALFADRGIQKTYQCLVEGHPAEPEARLEHMLWRDGVKKKSFVSTRKDAQRAVLHYKVLAAGDRYTRVEVDLETGRHHQIRCQMQAIGHPIKGDLKYGGKRPNADGGIDLCAQRIQFEHPVSKAPIDVSVEPEFSISF
jgi:23S rRNA pseudouridine1911/1915/1917 synthase